jgi:hypothetical protein
MKEIKEGKKEMILSVIHDRSYAGSNIAGRILGAIVTRYPAFV